MRETLRDRKPPDSPGFFCTKEDGVIIGVVRTRAKVLALIAVFALRCAAAWSVPAPLSYRSPYMKVVLAKVRPAFLMLAVDSLGNGRLSANLVRPPAAPSQAFEVRRYGQAIEYRPAGAPRTAPPAWTFQFSQRELRIRSSYSPHYPAKPLVAVFNPWVSHATLLGLENRDGTIRLPAILHFPDQGTFRITLSQGKGISLGYDAQRFSGHSDRDYVRVTFPAASKTMPAVEYTLDVVDIYPGGAKLAGDPRFEGFRRNFLNIFQLNPRRRVLANNAASDPCAFTVYQYATVALRTPPLAKGLTALDLIRQTLNRYLAGMKAYGMAGYSGTPSGPQYFLDTYPSLIMAASDYVSGTGDTRWLDRNYQGLK
ncbi:MAG: hypothetical protein ACRD3O_19675, partial [Terriglobia bacterium]